MCNRKAACESRVVTHFTFASIFIVDDFRGWWARVREILGAHPQWKIASEMSDEREAVRQASELQPDLVVLDIALPLLHGIEAAKMIWPKSRKSRIVFLAQDNDGDLMKAALGLGQTTYVQNLNPLLGYLTLSRRRCGKSQTIGAVVPRCARLGFNPYPFGCTFGGTHLVVLAMGLL
jgi:PleD family two-component response regulator